VVPRLTRARAPVFHHQFRIKSMLAHFVAKIFAVGWAAARLFGTHFRVPAAIAAATLTLGGCLPAYSSLRPAVPSSWRDQNDPAAPAPKSGQ